MPLLSITKRNGFVSLVALVLLYGLLLSVEEDTWDSNQRKRKRTILHYCDYYKDSVNMPTVSFLLQHRHTLANILVDDKNKALYCYIPKIACTEWKRIFMMMAGDTRYKRAQDIPHNVAHFYSGLINLGDKRFEDGEIIERIVNYKKFIFVRQPLERLLSAYRDKFESDTADAKAFKKIYAKNMLKKIRGETVSETGDGMKFVEFLAYLSEVGAQNSAGNFQEHWRPFLNLCHPCTISYDFIGKYDTIEEDSNQILRRLNVSSSIKFPHFINSRTKDLLANYTKGVPNDILMKISKVYEHDFRLFGYDIFV